MIQNTLVISNYMDFAERVRSLVDPLVAIGDIDENMFCETSSYSMIIIDHRIRRNIAHLISELKKEYNALIIVIGDDILNTKLLCLNEYGADLYYGSQINQLEFAAEVAVLNKYALFGVTRKDDISGDIYNQNGVFLNLSSRKALVDDTVIRLTEHEWRIISLIQHQGGGVCSMSALTEYFTASKDKIRMMIMRLRSKIDKENLERVIVTINTIGYKLA